MTKHCLQMEALRHLATRDILTHLSNRLDLEEAVEVGCEALANALVGIVVLLCDLNEFKPMNNTLGHQASDAVLGVVAGRLCSFGKHSGTARVAARSVSDKQR